MSKVFGLILDFISRPIPFALILLTFATAFIWLDNEAADLEQKCRRDLASLQSLDTQMRFDQVRLQLTELKSMLLKEQLRPLTDAKSKQLAAEVQSTQQDMHQSRRASDALGKAAKEIRERGEAVCSSASALNSQTSFAALLVTLLAGGFGFWAGTRKTAAK